MTPALYRLCQTKQRLFRVAKRTHAADDWKKYSQYRNKCTNEFRKIKSNYYNKQCCDIEREKYGSHRWWRAVKKVTGISSLSHPLPELHDGNKIVSDERAKADLLAKYFSAQCTTDDGLTGLADYDGAPFPLKQGHPEFHFTPVTEELVLRKLQCLSTNKSTSDRFITNRLMRECAPFIHSSLTYLFNLSISTNRFPTEFKQAIVTPLFKNRGSSNNPSNYRPVSLLSTIGKVLDDIQSARLLKYFLQEKLISTHQFGFLPFRSTVLQLLYIMEKWLSAKAGGKHVYAR